MVTNVRKLHDDSRIFTGVVSFLRHIFGFEQTHSSEVPIEAVVARLETEVRWIKIMLCLLFIATIVRPFIG